MPQGLQTKGPVVRGGMKPILVPQGTTTNDVLYWDDANKSWVALAAPATSGTFVLGVVDGVLKWMDTEGC